MVDTRDLKSLGQRCPYGFDSHPWHKTNNTIFSFNILRFGIIFNQLLKHKT